MPAQQHRLVPGRPQGSALRVSKPALGPDHHGERLLGSLLRFAAEVASELGLDADGYRIVTNTGKNAGQSVDHLHFHVLGGRKMTWPPG